MSKPLVLSGDGLVSSSGNNPPLPLHSFLVLVHTGGDIFAKKDVFPLLHPPQLPVHCWNCAG